MKINENVFRVLSICAISINFLLIILILKKSPKSLGSYKYLMLYINLFEFTYAILYCIEKPDLFTKGSAFFLIANFKKSIFPKLLACCSVLFYGGFYGITLAILALHFIYRFLSITNNRHLNSFNSWRIILWFMGPPISGIIFMLTGAFIMSSNGDSDRFLSENYPTLLENQTKIEDLYYVGPFFWPKYKNSTTEQYFNCRTAGGAMIVMGLISLSIAIMVYFGVNGYRSMNKLIAQSNSSQKFRSVQKQLFNALVLQTFIPVLLMHIPASAIYFTIFFDKCTEYLGKSFTLTVAMYPTFNPLPTIFIVKNYRNALKDSLICVQNGVLRRSRMVHPSSTAYSVNTQVS